MTSRLCRFGWAVACVGGITAVPASARAASISFTVNPGETVDLQVNAATLPGVEVTGFDLEVGFSPALSVTSVAMGDFFLMPAHAAADACAANPDCVSQLIVATGDPAHVPSYVDFVHAFAASVLPVDPTDPTAGYFAVPIDLFGTDPVSALTTPFDVISNLGPFVDPADPTNHQPFATTVSGQSSALFTVGFAASADLTGPTCAQIDFGSSVFSVPTFVDSGSNPLVFDPLVLSLKSGTSCTADVGAADADATVVADITGIQAQGVTEPPSLEPVPEPATLLLLGTGLATFARRRSKQR